MHAHLISPRRCVTSKPDQGLVYYSWREQKARCLSHNKANRVVSWCTGTQEISHCILFLFKVLHLRSLLYSPFVQGHQDRTGNRTLNVSSCDKSVMAGWSLGNEPDDELSH